MRIITLFILLFPLTIYSQKPSFEGTIWFSITYEASDSGISEDQLRMFGDQAIFSFRHSDFKKEYMNSKKLQFVQYNSDSNLYYDKYKDNDSIIVYNHLNNSDKMEVEEYDSTVKILGYDCIIAKAKNISPNLNTTYYFAKELNIDPSFTKNDKLYGDLRMMSQFHSIFLKKELEFGPYKATFTADSIRTQPLDKKIFELPPLQRRIK